MSQIRQRAVDGIRAGDRFCISRTFTPQEVEAFATLSRDYNPVHLEPRYAQAKGFDGVICHGLLVGSLLTEIGGQLGVLASGMDFRFRRPVYSGERIDCELRVLSVDREGRLEAKVTITNPRGETVTEASLRGRLPVGEDRQVMVQMLAEGDPTNGV